MSRLNPPERNPRPLVGFDVKGFSVGSWCPTPDGSGPATAVSICITVEPLGDLVLRLKSPETVDEVIQALLRHKRDVWPDAR